MSDNQPLSIIVPTLNEADNVPVLLARLEAALKPAQIPYEVLIVDDHSSDGTVEITRTLTATYPVRLIMKEGKRGKAYSLLQGFEEANNDLIVMIDADLQYPPEAIVPMYNLRASTDADVVVTRRQEKNVSAIRKLSTKVFNLIFARLLFGINFDTQSGLKLFKKRILNSFTMAPSPWSFDLEFLVRALENHYTIVSHDIQFAERSSGITKVRLLNVTFELMKASLQLRWHTSAPRVRAGYQANNQFLEKALQVLVIGVVLTVGSLFISPQTTSALSLSGVTNSVRNMLGGNNNSTPTSITPTTTGTTPQTTTTNPTTEIAPSSNTSTSITGKTSSTSSNANHKASTSKTAVVNVDNSDLAPATAEQNGSKLYGDSYPNYTLSSKTNDTLFGAGQFAWIAGALCLITAIIVSSIRATHKFGTSVISRS